MGFSASAFLDGDLDTDHTSHATQSQPSNLPPETFKTPRPRFHSSAPSLPSSSFLPATTFPPSSATGGDDGEGTPRPARQAVRARHHPGLQEVQVEPVREHVAAADRGGEHQGGRGVVLRQAHRLRLQGQDQEQRHHHPLHLGQGHEATRQLRRRPRQVPLQPPSQLHGQEGPRLHVPQQHLR